MEHNEQDTQGEDLNGKRMATDGADALPTGEAPAGAEYDGSDAGAKTEPLTPPDGAETVDEEPTVESLSARLAEVEQERDEYLDQWRRSAAEFQNFRKREERMRLDRERAAAARLLRRLLPVLDDLQRAAKHVPEALSDNDWVDGMLAIERKLWSVLEQEGVAAIDAGRGDPFDPKVHEALTTQPSEEVESDHILEELERGYRHRDAVLRPARVVVAK